MISRIWLERLRDAAPAAEIGHKGAYSSGYAVECALKACIAKHTRRFDFPDKRLSAQSHTHDLVKLIELAGLKSELDSMNSSDRAFELYWSLVKDWTVENRYSVGISPAKAQDLYDAIASKQSGVMIWLRRHW